MLIIIEFMAYLNDVKTYIPIESKYMHIVHTPESNTKMTGIQIDADAITKEMKVSAILRNSLFVAHIFDNVSQQFQCSLSSLLSLDA